jgi:hypothetical protein
MIGVSDTTDRKDRQQGNSAVPCTSNAAHSSSAMPAEMVRPDTKAKK